MDVPGLLHPQYPSGSTSYCTRAAAQISLESAEKTSKRSIDRTCIYSSRDREMAREYSIWSRLETFVQKKLNNNELVWSKPAVRSIQLSSGMHAPRWPRPLLSHVCAYVLAFYFADLIFVDRQSTAKTAKIGSLENFRPYGIRTPFAIIGASIKCDSHNYSLKRKQNLIRVYTHTTVT